jgi:tripartite-type tricarboxylate transporter receptor subunit TctC
MTMNDAWQKACKVAIIVFPLLLLAPFLCYGDEFPTRPINMTVGISTGGTVDISSRLLAKAAEKSLGQPILVSNNGGGAGSVALSALSKSKPDGYQLVASPHTPLVEVPALRKVPYKLDDFTPIMHYCQPDSGLVVRSDSPYKSLKELIEYARKNPGKVTFSTSGTLTPMHLAMMHIARKEGVEWTAIPVPGGDPNMPLLGGHVTAFSAATSWKRYIDEGKFRLLAVYSEKRMKDFPDVPTIKELGYDFVAHMFYMITAPKATPAPVVRKLDSAFRKAMDDPEFVSYMKKAALTISYRDSAETKKHLVETARQFEKVIVDLKIPREQ